MEVIMKRIFSTVILVLCGTLGAYAQEAIVSPTATPVSSSGSEVSAQTTASLALKGDRVARSAVVPPEKLRPITLSHFNKPPVIDGRLDEEVWQASTVLKDFYQTQPGDNIPPSKETEVLLGYDEKYLYLGFRAHDEPGKVRATVAKRDAISADDNVTVYLDTYNDKRKAYILAFNPLGVQADGIFTEGIGEDYSFDLVMESKGVVTDDGYTVEVAIPFKSLRYAAGTDKLWGVHFFREIKRFNGEIDSWMPISRDISGTLNQEGHLKTPEGISSARTLELIPSLTLSETGKRVAKIPPAILDNNPGLLDPGRVVNQPLSFDPGLNVKYGITPTVTLDLALNPDFAQVEADQKVVTANQRFPIFFEEKRPFFLEGIDIFQTPLTAVHTRAIIDPDFAVKLTGKVNRNTFGLLLASDNAPGNFTGDERLDPNNAPFLDKNAYIGVLRLKHDVGKESSIGMIATTYNFIQEHNQLGGVDGRFRLSPQTVFDFQVLGTTSRHKYFDPDSGSSNYRTGNALGYYFSYDTAARHLSYNFTGSGRTRDYRADVGFTRRTNTNREDFTVRYKSEPDPKAKLVYWRLYNDIGTNFSWQGRMQSWNNETQLRLAFQHQTTLNFGFSGGYERLFEEEFGPKRTLTQSGAFAGPDSERSAYNKDYFIYGDTTPNKQFSASFSFDYILNAFDFDFGAPPRFQRVSPDALIDQNSPLDPGPGKEIRASVSLTYQPTAALRTSLDYTKDRLVRNDTKLVAYDENIWSLHSTYQFTRFTFARARIDFDSLNSNISGQFLLGWAPNPGTSFYVGYNDDLNHNGFNPYTGQLEPGFQRNGRTFFIKMSYLFRHSF
jgi:Domain of unknown function (DUF5916)/Carbohydrate family 9 binding domain-like